MARRQQLRAGAAERGIAKLPDLLSRRQTWGAYRHHWEYSGGNLRQIKLIAPRLDYGTAMPAIRICIAVSLALCFAAGPARAQFWGNNWGNGWRSRCVPRSKIFNVQALGGSLRGRVSLWRGMTFV